jgi:ATP-binding cassette subfamily B protein
VSARDVVVKVGQRALLKKVSFRVPAGTRTAVVGPTGAGKTHLLYLFAGLQTAESGDVEVDGKSVGEYRRDSLRSQIGVVFQEAAILNATLRENIAFSHQVTDDALDKAIRTAELKDFVDALPAKLDTLVSEGGRNLSGGQKQRIMLARALALNPRVLLLDDFTARIDVATERKIIDNLRANYTGMTILAVTQKIAPVEDYEQIILLMEGEVLASGTHGQLMATSPEYVQIHDSQRSTTQHEA